MSNHYRLNVRFDLDDEAERRAAEYLAELNNEKGKLAAKFNLFSENEKVQKELEEKNQEYVEV